MWTPMKQIEKWKEGEKKETIIEKFKKRKRNWKGEKKKITKKKREKMKKKEKKKKNPIIQIILNGFLADLVILCT